MNSMFHALNEWKEESALKTHQTPVTIICSKKYTDYRSFMHRSRKIRRGGATEHKAF